MIGKYLIATPIERELGVSLNTVSPEFVGKWRWELYYESCANPVTSGWNFSTEQEAMIDGNSFINE